MFFNHRNLTLKLILFTYNHLKILIFNNKTESDHEN